MAGGSILAMILVGLVAIFHVAVLVLEMFYWDHRIGRKIFRMTPEVSASSKVLAANQGLYNGFLAAGIAFAWFTGNLPMLKFMLACVIVAGIYGALTAKPSIFFTQALPAILALVVVWMGW